MKAPTRSNIESFSQAGMVTRKDRLGSQCNMTRGKQPLKRHNNERWRPLFVSSNHVALVFSFQRPTTPTLNTSEIMNVDTSSPILSSNY
ncbi:hypothetical protein M0804_001816 [Polistes exclamans]|nr:hypothetical protein M0804_001816 [Polistes exclamans]